MLIVIYRVAIGFATAFGFTFNLATCFAAACLGISNIKCLARGTVGLFLVEGKVGITNLVILTAILLLDAKSSMAPHKERKLQLDVYTHSVVRYSSQNYTPHS